MIFDADWLLQNNKKPGSCKCTRLLDPLGQCFFRTSDIDMRFSSSVRIQTHDSRLSKAIETQGKQTFPTHTGPVLEQRFGNRMLLERGDCARGTFFHLACNCQRLHSVDPEIFEVKKEKIFADLKRFSISSATNVVDFKA